MAPEEISGKVLNSLQKFNDLYQQKTGHHDGQMYSIKGINDGTDATVEGWLIAIFECDGGYAALKRYLEEFCDKGFALPRYLDWWEKHIRKVRDEVVGDGEALDELKGLFGGANE